MRGVAWDHPAQQLPNGRKGIYECAPFAFASFTPTPRRRLVALKRPCKLEPSAYRLTSPSIRVMLLEKKKMTVAEFKELAESKKHSHSPQSLKDDVAAHNYEAIENSFWKNRNYTSNPPVACGMGLL